ncbi:MAG: hypothetical protein FWD61_15455, partial [Phycisphaerales bacterium]|nr:hypothetical protein [Phycisphaerales bacterium]
MKMRVLIAVMIAAAGMMAGDAGGSEMGNGRGGDETQALETFSKASEALYQKVSHSIVRVKVDQIGMPKELQKEFEAFVKKETGGIGTGGGAANGPRKHAEKEEAGPTTVPGRATTRLTLARRFLEQKLKNTTDAELQAKIRLSLGRVEAIHNGRPTREVLGVVIDDQGHTLVASLAREIQAGAGGSGGMLHVMVPDGSDMMAKYVGAHMDRGWVVLKLESLGSSVSAGLAVGRPAPGALLMGMTPQGAVGYITAPGQGKKVEEKFPIVGGGGVGGAGEEHGMTYLFNTQGELAALGAGAGGGTDRQAVTIDSIREEIDWIIGKNKE